jgi:hypothetical protein
MLVENGASGGVRNQFWQASRKSQHCEAKFIISRPRTLLLLLNPENNLQRQSLIYKFAKLNA